MAYQQKFIQPKEFNYLSTRLREFFLSRGYLEVFPQPYQSIMAACEDPKTIGTFVWQGKNYPLPQTNQMWLEYFLLTNPDIPGVFCFTTSYRNEPFPIEGRHDLIFPMFEFESKGGYEDLLMLMDDLCVFLGFVPEALDIHTDTYDAISTKFSKTILDAEDETMMQKKYGNVVTITDFPHRTHPFWNMKQSGKVNQFNEPLYNKADYIIYGIETFGTAERSCNKQEMYDNFHSISDGEYSGLLFHHFGRERVEQELAEYLALDMFPRFGGGIGMTRLLRALKLNGNL
jgi:aspartyl/asparaginyl-tRNA synthetase